MKRILILMTTILALAACKDWTQMENIPTDINHPWEQDPSVWEAYTSSLQAYKQSGHTLVYARLANSPEPAASEKNFMRCLPDSLDIVSLTNDFSEHDAEDMAMMKKKGTKVLLQVNVLEDEPAYAVKTVEDYDLDGWAVTGTPDLDDASSVADMAAVVKAVREAKKDGQLLVFEGNPLFVAEADRTEFDLYVLDTEEMSAAMDVRLSVLSAENYGIPGSRLLLAGKVEGLEATASYVLEYGPLAGLAVYDIEEDYYHYDGNYIGVRSIIQTLNPSR